MDIRTACSEFEAGRLQDAVIEPADAGNGWRVSVHDLSGAMLRITDHRGAEKIYHSMDHATAVVKGIGFKRIRVEERF